MSALMLLFQKLERFLLCKTARLLRLVVQKKIRERFADHHADLSRRTVVRFGISAATLVRHNVGRTVQHEIARGGIGNNLFEVLQGDSPVHGNHRARPIVGHDFTVIGIA